MCDNTCSKEKPDTEGSRSRPAGRDMLNFRVRRQAAASEQAAAGQALEAAERGCALIPHGGGRQMKSLFEQVLSAGGGMKHLV